MRVRSIAGPCPECAPDLGRYRRMCWVLRLNALLVAGVLLLGGAGPGRADDKEKAKDKSDKKSRIVTVDLNKLPPELAKQLLKYVEREGDRKKEAAKVKERAKDPETRKAAGKKTQEAEKAKAKKLDPEKKDPKKADLRKKEGDKPDPEKKESKEKADLKKKEKEKKEGDKEEGRKKSPKKDDDRN